MINAIDDFSQPTLDLGKWGTDIKVGSTITIVNGWVRILQSSAHSGATLSTKGNESTDLVFKKFKAEFDMQIAGGSYRVSNAGILPYIGFVSPDAPFDNTYYYPASGKGLVFEFDISSVRLGRRSNGAYATNVVAQANSNMGNYAVHHVVVECIDDVLTLHVDGVQVIKYVVTASDKAYIGDLAEFHFYLGNYNSNQSLNLDNVYITSKTPPTQIPSVTLVTNRVKYLPSESFMVSWAPSTDPDGGAVLYDVEVLTNNGWVEHVTGITATNTTLVVPNVNTVVPTSKVRVRACNDVVCNDWVMSREFKITPSLLLLEDDGKLKYLDNGSLIEVGTKDYTNLLLRGMDNLDQLTEGLLRSMVNPKVLSLDLQALEREVVIGGTPSGAYRYRAELLTPQPIVLQDWTEYFYGSGEYTVTVPTGLFTSTEPRTLQLTGETSDGTQIIKTATLTLINTLPTIDLKLNGNTIEVDIDDADGDGFEYGVTLNGETVVPTHGGLDSTKESKVSLRKVLTSEDIQIGSPNIIEVYTRDAYGGEQTAVYPFQGEYFGILFSDEYGNYYSTDLGEVLKKLSIAPIVAGGMSDIYSVKLINKHGTSVNNIRLWLNYYEEVPNTLVKFSKTAQPFMLMNELTYPDKLQTNGEITFYVRLFSQNGAVGKGKFNITARAVPMEGG